MKSHDCTDTILLPSSSLTARTGHVPGAKGQWFARLWNAPVAILVYIANCLYTWQDRSDQRRQLGQMDDRMLEDMGLTRAEAAFEAKKPFWVR